MFPCFFMSHSYNSEFSSLHSFSLSLFCYLFLCLEFKTQPNWSQFILFHKLNSCQLLFIRELLSPGVDTLHKSQAFILIVSKVLGKFKVCCDQHSRQFENKLTLWFTFTTICPFSLSAGCRSTPSSTSSPNHVWPSAVWRMAPTAPPWSTVTTVPYSRGSSTTTLAWRLLATFTSVPRIIFSKLKSALGGHVGGPPEVSRVAQVKRRIEADGHFSCSVGM